MRHHTRISFKCSSCFIICFIISFITWSLQAEIQYSWLEHNDRYDTIVGISAHGKPVSSGIILSAWYIISAANAIERYNNNDLFIHVIDGDYNKNKILKLEFAARNQFQRNKEYWFTVGLDERNNPCHDFTFLTLDSRMELNLQGRMPASDPYGWWRHIVFEASNTFEFVGFGFIDKTHVKQNYQLELVQYPVDEAYENCADWFPQSWGNFICLKNLENFVGISTGAALYFNNLLVGIGSFAVKRGNDGVLVFTDLRKYPRGFLALTNKDKKYY